MIRFFVAAIAAISLLAFPGCKPKKKEAKDYVDVSSYLKGQLKHIDTMPFAFLKVLQQDSFYTDSQFISKDQVKAIIQPFLAKEIEKEKFEENFKEMSFADETTETITINYEATTEKSSISRIDIYVNPEKERISQVYLVRHESKGDSAITQQLLWKHNKSFILITSAGKKNETEKTITEKVIWDDREEQ
jgi:thiol:disulfide interchange protein